MGRGREEGSLLCRVMGFQLLSSGAWVPPAVPELLGLSSVLRSLEFAMQQGVNAILLKSGACTQPSLPQSILCVKSHLSHSMPLEKCVTTCWQCEMLEEMGLGHSLT